MKVFILCAIVILSCAKNVKLSPIENNEVDPVDSLSDDNELNADVIHESIQPFNHDEQVDENSNIETSDVNTDDDVDGENPLNEDGDEEEDVNNDDLIEKDKKERTYGIEIPICAQYAEVTYPLHVSHLTDCGKFYKCSNGRGYLFDCPSGEFWSVKLDRCDYPFIAGCTIDGTHQFKLQKTVKPKQASENEDDEDQEDTADEDAFGDFEIDPRCEGIDPYTPVQFSHPNDCTKYYKCYLGKAYVMKCPKGQNFGQRINRCDHPSQARCFAIKPASQ